MRDRQDKLPIFAREIREITGQVFYEHRRARTRAQMEGAIAVLLILLVVWLLADRISSAWQNAGQQPVLQQMK